MSEPEMCVCGHGIRGHMPDGSGKCDERAFAWETYVDDKPCYCPRFIPRPPPPGTMPNEGKKESLR